MVIGASRMRGWACACLVALLAACGGGDATTSLSPSASPSAPASLSASPAGRHVTLTDEECTSTPPVPLPLSAGLTQLTLLNDSSRPGVFELLRIGSTFEEFDQFLVDARARIDAGEPPPGELPNIDEEVARTRLEPGGVGVVAGHLNVGTYAVICVVVTEDDDIVTVYAVGPYTVTE